MAEYFRDVERKDVLLFIDNIFRFTQAGSEVSTLLGRMPSAVGYQPTLADGDGRAAGADHVDDEGRSITSRAGDLRAGRRHRPTRRRHTAFAHLDATTVLSPRHRGARAFTRRWTRSTRRAGSWIRATWARSTTTSARRVQEILQRYKDLQDIIAILGVDELSEEDKVIVRAGAEDPAVPVAAVLRGRAVHGDPGQVRAGRRDDRVVQGHLRGRVRPPARAGVPARGRHRGGRRAGEADERPPSGAIEVHLVTPEREVWSGTGRRWSSRTASTARSASSPATRRC